MALDRSIIGGIAARSVTGKAATRSAHVEPFIAIRISLAWASSAVRAGAPDIAWAVLYRYGLAKRKSFTASADDLTLGEVSIDTARRQLRKLEAIGLVRVEHHPGCKPTITVIDSPTNDQENHT